MRKLNEVKELHLFVIIAPSFAFADQVAPILDSINGADWNANLTAIIPSPQIVLEYDRDWLPARILQDLSTSVIFRSYTGRWICSPSFETARAVGRSIQLIGRLYRKLCGLKISWPARACAVVERHLVELVGKGSSFQRTPQIPPGSKVFIDITELTKPYFEDLLQSLCFSDCYGIGHGLGFPTISDDIDDAYHQGSVSRVVRSAKVLSQSRGESSFYARVLGVPPINILEVGVLRHSENWLDRFNSPSKQNQGNVAGHLVLVSRPVGPWLPRERKLRNLRAIRRVASEFGFGIIVKRHPKEIRDGLLLRGLGNPLSKYGWRISRLHVLELANSSQLAITFDSGTCLDFLASGIPTIQLLDLSGLAGIVGAERDQITGQPVSQWVKSGVVLHAFDEESLRRQITRLKKNSVDMINTMRTRFSSEFFPTVDVNQVLVGILGAEWSEKTANRSLTSENRGDGEL